MRINKLTALFGIGTGGSFLGAGTCVGVAVALGFTGNILPAIIVGSIGIGLALLGFGLGLATIIANSMQITRTQVNQNVTDLPPTKSETLVDIQNNNHSSFQNTEENSLHVTHNMFSKTTKLGAGYFD